MLQVFTRDKHNVKATLAKSRPGAVAGFISFAVYRAVQSRPWPGEAELSGLARVGDHGEEMALDVYFR